ncbi:MAG: NAD(P)H-dependent oxidoreductase subunit E [Verrucomicrobiota bacterium]
MTTLATDEFTLVRQVDEFVDKIGQRPEDLPALLQALQREFHYLPPPALDRLAEQTGLTPARIHGVVSFYPDFRMRPAGRHTIQVCVGTACHVKGAENIHQAFRRHLDINENEDTDAEGQFTVAKAACLGCCMLAPAVRIDDVIYGHLTPGGVGEVLDDFLAADESPADANAELRPPNGAGEIRVCLCSSCRAAGAQDLFGELRKSIKQRGYPVVLAQAACTEPSTQAPALNILTSSGTGFRYANVHPEDADGILHRHFRPGNPLHWFQSAGYHLLEALLLGRAIPKAVNRYTTRIQETIRPADLAIQTRVATDSAGEISPLNIEEYRAAGGFQALEHALTLPPETIIETVRASGLRGRGGGGFPTWQKWRQVRDAADHNALIICNADEGDPGAFMDRMLLESFPFRVLEGLAIAALAVGATEGIIYVRAEYPLAIERLEKAIQLAADQGYLGDRMRNGEHTLNLHIHEGAGAFVCGEETALIAALEGRRGMPEIRPPYPAESGFRGRPTLVNNVETYSLVPWIMRRGAAPFAALGTDNSHGTKVFSLAGAVRRGGLIEVPMGTTIRQIAEDIGGGVPSDGASPRTFKAVQVGGPSGGCIPASLADTPVDYEALLGHGSMMGSGGIVVLDDTSCMVEISRYFLAFTQDQSCGKCTLCRIGTLRLLEILETLCAGTAAETDIERLEELALVVQRGSLCGLGRSAPNPILSTLRHFRPEYKAHVNGFCPALQCRSLIRYDITEDCIGCTLCARHCPVNAIEYKPYQQHVVDHSLCVRCGTCESICPANAVRRIPNSQRHDWNHNETAPRKEI